jgi:hypothetical protein
MAQANGNSTHSSSGMQEELQEILNQAEVDFDRSQQEMYRSSTDVVLYSACFFARRALHHYLYYCYKKFDGPNADQSPHELTIQEMAEFCTKYDNRIGKIDFENMHCSRSDVLEEDEVFFCNDVDKVNSCKNLAEQMREIVYS